MNPSKWHNLGYLFWAYTLIWGLLAGYLFILAGRLQRLRREMHHWRSGEEGDGQRH
ncbi:MAG: CcmD family protein [Acidobacteriota bacterium]